MQAISSCQDWFIVDNARTPNGSLVIAPICAFGLHNNGTPAVVVVNSGSLEVLESGEGKMIKHLSQLREEEAVAAGVMGRWRTLRK